MIIQNNLINNNNNRGIWLKQGGSQNTDIIQNTISNHEQLKAFRINLISSSGV